MTIFFSIASHLDHDIIINLGVIKTLNEFDEINVVCRDNTPNSKLRIYCEKFGAHYIANSHEQGFAANNNANFLFCKERLGMQDQDYFILLNPDIDIIAEQVTNLVKTLSNKKVELAACNLYLDREEIVHDDNIRLYPKFNSFVKTYLLNDRSTMVHRGESFEISENHWINGSFMVVQARAYQSLLGLDEQFYLYCEDIDFCYRAKIKGYKLTYLKNVRAVHFKRRDSKHFLSKYFFWHVKSAFIYSFRSKSIRAKKSQLGIHTQ
jgi:N-acetylglucosaminyl-diphospho-decaprenol L-rhamnosyltransferase